MMPAPENAYAAQMKSTPAMASVKSVGCSFPDSTARAIFSPAPMNRYARGPTAMQARCATAAAALSVPPTMSACAPETGMEWFVRPNRLLKDV